MRSDSREGLSSLLFFDRHTKQFFLKDYRMVMFSACALGALRKELLETLGWQQTRGLLKRFGYAAGLIDGKALRERFPGVTEDGQFKYDALLQAAEGMARVVEIPGKSRIDLSQGLFHLEAFWEDSFEALQHLEGFGESEEPVCWTLAGYASGHSTVAVGQKTLAVEVECRAMGYRQCRFVVDFEENVAGKFAEEQRDYGAVHFPERFRELHRAIAEKEKTIAELRRLALREGPPLELQRIEDEKERIARALEIAAGHRDRAAGLLGISRTTLWRRMRDYEIER